MCRCLHWHDADEYCQKGDNDCDAFHLNLLQSCVFIAFNDITNEKLEMLHKKREFHKKVK